VRKAQAICINGSIIKKSCFIFEARRHRGHVLVENANGPVVRARASQASGFAESETALAMLAERTGDAPPRLG
jgi:hypothetical protein